MSDYIRGKSIIVTGAGGGFGRLISQKAAALGANMTCIDIDKKSAQETVALIEGEGGSAQFLEVDVTDISHMKRGAKAAIEHFGRIDVIVNNAGVMPLAFFSDHEVAIEKWQRCIDINIKGVLNGIISVYDQMMEQGDGHVINISSIYGNHPVVGAGVYGATKTAVNFLSESLRVETRGKIKVTIIKPTGVPATGLASGVVNPQAAIGIVGQNTPDYIELMRQMMAGDLDPNLLDHDQMNYISLDPAFIAEQVIHVINQPKGVSIGDITVRASGDHYIL